MKESFSPEDQDKKKTEFFSRFALQNKEAFRMHKKSGLLGQSVSDAESWRNVSEHCLVEAAAADALARQLGVSEPDRQLLVTAAVLHDFYKKAEAKLRKTHPATFVDEGGSETSRVLRENGYNERIIQLTESVGHPSLPRMQDSAVTLLEKIIHYVDDITQESDLVMLDKRMDALETNSKYRSTNEAGRALHGGRTYYEVQREVGKRIESEFAKQLGLENSAELPLLIKQWIEDSYR